jgi:hypothetical protein
VKPRRVDGRLWLGGHLVVYVEPRDAWRGLFFGEQGIYWCPLPLLVVKWTGNRPRFLAALLAVTVAAMVAAHGWWKLIPAFELGLPTMLAMWRGSTMQRRLENAGEHWSR